MDLSRLMDVGAAQRRYRTQLAKEGWRPICTYTRIEHRLALEQLQRQHELNTLHEALDLVLTACTLPPFRIAFRKKIYATIDELQADLDAWITGYNELRTHQGRYCYGKTPIQTFLDAVPAAREKQIGDQVLATASA